MAYNEEANIANAIETVLGQQLTTAELDEVIVVASGCTDRTVDIVTSIAGDDPRVRLIVQERREGKASAINLFIGAAQSPVLLMVSADLMVENGTLDVLMRHFDDPEVGMVGGHPIPINDERTFLGHAVHLLWRLHDQVARQSPKLGEIVAFRNIVPSIPFDTPVDEISIQALITQLGYKLVYEPRAIVYNRGPATVGDFVRQRRRIHAGHLQIKRQQSYAASTMSVGRIGPLLLRSGSFTTPRTALWTAGTVALEATARALGYYDSSRGQPHHVWDMAATTKRHIADEAKVREEQSVLVFHIVNFHRHELELGVRGGRQLARGVLRRIKEELGPDAVVTPQLNGTVIALLDGNREEAERVAGSLVEELSQNPPTGSRLHDGQFQLACGIIAFSQVGPLVKSIPDPVLEAELVPVGVG